MEIFVSIKCLTNSLACFALISSVLIFLISSIMFSIQIVGIVSTFVSFFEICPRNSIHNHLYTSFESLQFEFISLNILNKLYSFIR